MITHRFTIHGNQEDIMNGNPVPYKRVLKQAMRAESVRYHDWLDYVRGCFYDYAAKNKIPLRYSPGAKPLTMLKGQRAIMIVSIGWKNDAHGDTDNVWKGIADALFDNDKNIDVFAYGITSPVKRGYAHVRIEIREKDEPYDAIVLVNEQAYPSGDTGTRATPPGIPGEASTYRGAHGERIIVRRQTARAPTEGSIPIDGSRRTTGLGSK